MPNIVAIGGGAGTFNVLYGIKRNPGYNISAIISVADNGGTTWAIRDKYGILPPGDMRRAIAALAKNTEMVRKLFEYSFKWEEGVIGSNKIGNILLTALVDICGGDFEKAIKTMEEMFDVRWRVIPVTLENVHLGVRFADGAEVIGEKNIDISDKNPGERTHDIDQDITDAWLVGAEGNLNPHAKEALLNADYIIIGPGDLYTSIVPNLLSKWMKEVRGETTNMEVIDFINVIERYINPGMLDYVIVNNGNIDEDVVIKYKIEENKKPLKIKDHSLFEWKWYKIIEWDMVNDHDIVRHDPIKLAKVIEDIVSGWIK